MDVTRTPKTNYFELWVCIVSQNSFKTHPTSLLNNIIFEGPKIVERGEKTCAEQSWRSAQHIREHLEYGINIC